MGFLQQLIFLYLASYSDCLKIIKSNSNLNGSFTISNFSLDSLAEFSLCLRVFSYSFSSPKEKSVQSLVTLGDKSLLGIVTHQHCHHCNESQSRLQTFFDNFF